MEGLLYYQSLTKTLTSLHHHLADNTLVWMGKMTASVLVYELMGYTEMVWGCSHEGGHELRLRAFLPSLL